jgi:hypothetical protein
MPVPSVIKQWQYADSIPRIIWDRNYVYENWNVVPCASAKVGGAAAVSIVNVMNTRFNTFEYNMLEAAGGDQATLVPVVVDKSTGVSALDIGGTQIDNGGYEICPGILSSHPLAFIAGTSSAFFLRVRFSIEDVSGTDDCAIGFRKAEAYQAAIDNYADMAVLNVISGNINIETIVGGAATVTTDTTDNWADLATHELKVLVSSDGVVTYQIDGAAPTVTAAYSFTAAATVVPFIYFLNSGDLAGAVDVLEFECGYQS